MTDKNKHQAKVPHEDIEWDSDADSAKFYDTSLERLRIEPNDSGGYSFTFFWYEYDTIYETYEPVEDCTPETIDAIVAKLQYFKRVVFGEGD